MVKPSHTEARITLRPMFENDIEFLKRLYRTTRHDIAWLPMSDEEKTQFCDHQFRAQHVHYQQCFPNANFDIVLSVKTRIGRLYVQYGSTEIHIIDIAILPEHRGSGVGTKLMGEILDQAELKKIPVRLRVEPNNPALHLYTRLGFKKIADEEINWYMEWNSKLAEPD